jgi:hypothetical protein
MREEAAAGRLGVAPESLLAWAVYPDRVVVILADGRKVSVPREEPTAVKPVGVKERDASPSRARKTRHSSAERHSSAG